MYKTEIFYSWYNLKKFLNEHDIKKADIMYIGAFGQGVVLLYHTESEE